MPVACSDTPKFLFLSNFRQVSKIKINTKLNSVEDAPFFKKKMAKGTKMLSIAGLPK